MRQLAIFLVHNIHSLLSLRKALRNKEVTVYVFNLLNYNVLYFIYLLIICSLICSDSGVFVAAFAEYISDGIPVSCNSFKVDYLRKRYATLLWKYGLDKAKEGYASDNDDPPKPRGNFLQIDYDNLIDLV